MIHQILFIPLTKRRKEKKRKKLWKRSLDQESQQNSPWCLQIQTCSALSCPCLTHPLSLTHSHYYAEEKTVDSSPFLVHVSHRISRTLSRTRTVGLHAAFYSMLTPRNLSSIRDPTPWRVYRVQYGDWGSLYIDQTVRLVRALVNISIRTMILIYTKNIFDELFTNFYFVSDAAWWTHTVPTTRNWPADFQLYTCVCAII